MNELFKRFLYTSIGLVASAADQLASQNAAVECEGQRRMDEWRLDAETRQNDMENRLQLLVDRVLSSAKSPSRREFEILQARLAALEARFADKP